MSTDNKMKGLLKGLRFISQIIFDNNEKQPDIKIGHPTDVRHVAHIGWDGPSENPPGWMNEFKSTSGFSSAPLNMNGDNHSKESDDSVKWVSTDSMKRGSRSVNCQSQEEDISTKSSKRQSNSNSTGNTRESHAKEKSDKPRQQKRSSSKHTHSNDSFNGSKSTEQPPPIPLDSDSLQLHGNDLPPKILPENTKRSHSKKTKDAHGVGSSSKTRSKAQHRDPNNNIEGPHSGSSSKPRNKHRNSEDDDAQLARGSNEDVLINSSN